MKANRETIFSTAFGDIRMGELPWHIQNLVHSLECVEEPWWTFGAVERHHKLIMHETVELYAMEQYETFENRKKCDANA
jgi:hypothetical protein